MIIKWKRLLVITLLAIAFIYRFNANKVEWYFQYVVSAPVLFLGFRSLIKKHSKSAQVARRLFILATAPYLIAYLYTLLLYLFGACELTTLPRGFSQTMQYCYCIAVTASVIAMFGKESVDILLYSCLCSYGITTAMAFFGIGVSGVIAYFVNPFTSLDNGWFEMHDVCLAMGLLFIYLLNVVPKGERNWKHIVLSGLVIYMGFKRVGIFALVVTIIIAHFVRRREGKQQKTKLFAITVGIFIVCYLYTYFITSGLFERILSGMNINTMGRLTFYSYFIRFYEWSLLFLGRGVGFVTKQLSITKATEGGAKYGLYGVMALHNDILKTYIELGFVGSVLWFLYYLRYMTAQLKKRYGYRTERTWCLLLIYAFITYSTDNTMNYYVFQIVFYTIIASVALQD